MNWIARKLARAIGTYINRVRYHFYAMEDGFDDGDTFTGCFQAFELACWTGGPLIFLYFGTVILQCLYYIIANPNL